MRGIRAIEPVRGRMRDSADIPNVLGTNTTLKTSLNSPRHLGIRRSDLSTSSEDSLLGTPMKRIELARKVRTASLLTGADTG